MKKVYYYWNENGNDGITTDLDFAVQQDNVTTATYDDLLSFVTIGCIIEGLVQVQEGLYLWTVNGEETDYIKISLGAVA